MAVTVDDVVSAYRFLLGREPTKQETSAWLRVESVSDLRRSFFASTECQNEMRAQIPCLQQSRLPIDLDPIEIDCLAAPEAEERLLRYMTETWTRLGAQEPHWSVLSSDVFKASNIQNTKREFFASGARDAAMVKAILARHDHAPANFSRIVEYGCGVGRVTPHLAAHFDEVIGVDISESHLEIAREEVSKSGKGNVRLTLARSPDFGMTESFDLWFSYIVLQHNPPPLIALVLKRMFAMLAPGGVAIFQVPTYVPGYRFNLDDYLAAPKSGAIEVHCFPQKLVFQIAHAAGCTPLDVREDSAMGHPWLSNTFVFKK